MAAPAGRLRALEWKLGVSAASDGVDAVGRSFVQLNLRVEHADKEEQVLVELSVEQFYSFLKALETAQQLM